MIEKNIIYFTGDKIELKNKNNSTAVIYNTMLGSLKVIRVDLKIKNISLTQHISNLEVVNIYLQGIGFEVELKEPETAAEILEEMKRKAKPFNSDTTNCVVIGNCVTGKVSTSIFSCVEIFGALYFEKEVAKDFAKRLQAAFERDRSNND